MAKPPKKGQERGENPERKEAGRERQPAEGGEERGGGSPAGGDIEGDVEEPAEGRTDVSGGAEEPEE